MGRRAIVLGRWRESRHRQTASEMGRGLHRSRRALSVRAQTVCSRQGKHPLGQGKFEIGFLPISKSLTYRLYNEITMELTLGPAILKEVIQHAKNAYPNEACGLLVGRTAADRFIPMTNISANAREYEIDPAELIKTLRALRETGENLISIFHSHPHGPADPSKTD